MHDSVVAVGTTYAHWRSALQACGFQENAVCLSIQLWQLRLRVNHARHVVVLAEAAWP
jgi:hypothetical protein